MSMLAEPKRRKRYNLVPRGKALYDDDNRFGTKMLQKMGWSKGDGLGKESKGNVNFVRVRYKNDAEGFGYQNRDDQWQQHHADFDGLLQSLNNSQENTIENRGNKSDTDEEGRPSFGIGFSAEPKEKKSKLKDKFSGESLEKKSKESKARVHYKKFTKGKDLSQYSEKDLANIFGKKSSHEEMPKDTTPEVTVPSVGITSTTQESKEDDIAVIKTTKSELSISDYFKQKMESKKNKVKMESIIILEHGVSDSENNTLEEDKCKEISSEQVCNENIKKHKKKRKKSGDLNKRETENLKTSKKKRKKSNIEIEIIENTLENVNNIGDMEEEKVKDSSIVIQGNYDSLPDKDDINDNNTHPNSELKNDAEVEDPGDKNGINKEQKIKLMNKKSKKLKRGIGVLLTENDDLDYLNREARPLGLKDEDAGCSAKDTFDKTAQTSDVKDNHNVYTISAFCAEKFCNIDLDQFCGSNLSEIPGYGCDENTKLEVQSEGRDVQRIINLWNGRINKYDDEQSKSNYNNYVKQVKSAYKQKKKIPRLPIKAWKRNAFEGI